MRKIKVQSPLGNLEIDTVGAPVAAIKLEPDKAYLGVPVLLQKYINYNGEKAWSEIKVKIDYIYENIANIMSELDAETGFEKGIISKIKSGKRLFFKPNLVTPLTLDPLTHGAGVGDSSCTEWTVIAALMRWFHDKLGISYNLMGIGEAASALSMLTATFNLFDYGKGQHITTEAVIEGRSGNFYGGWQFYFVRKYLQDNHPASHKDNPMNGYDESVAGKYFAPGQAGNRLMVYDLNRIETHDKGRQVPVPNGVNFQGITIHKAIIGGDPSDPQDMKNYPGCVLVNVPKLKIHSQDLITNAIKNLGIGLYPMEYPRASGDHHDWEYASPFASVPGMKTEIPHTPWVPEMDDATMLPKMDAKGNYHLKKTRGMPGTQADIIKAVQHQGIYALHLSDAIETVNINHTGNGTGVKIPEGYLFAGLDCVAMDLCCARYMINMVPMAEAIQIREKQNLSTEFSHKAPVAKIEGKNIITAEDIDSPLFHYGLYDYVEKRGVGTQKYYLVGKDTVTGNVLASLQGHLGMMEDNKFRELITKTFYYNPNCFLWDMQKTCFTYLQAHDALLGTNFYKEMMQAFDENKDGAIDYDENGRYGYWMPVMRMGAYSMYLRAIDKLGTIKGAFLTVSYVLRFSVKKWNTQGHEFLNDYRFNTALATAYALSRVPAENPDPFVPGMCWGKGKWPSLTLVNHISNIGAIYGGSFPERIDLYSLYGYAFQYADKTLNGGKYTGSTGPDGDANALNKYLADLKQGMKKLAFEFYVPAGYGKMGQLPVPNVIETADPSKIFSVAFDGEKEVWTTDFNSK